MKRDILQAWASFLGSYIFILVIDYFMRSSDGNIKTGGISMAVLWSIWVPFILFSSYKLFTLSKDIKNIYYKIAFFTVNISVPILVILILGMLYTVETGIDAF